MRSWLAGLPTGYTMARWRLRRGRPVLWSIGSVRWAHSDPIVEFSLSRMHSYLSLGVPSELVRERILSDRLADSFGRDGRELLADVLDYALELELDARPRRRTRKRFFRALNRLNDGLAKAGLGYYVFASLEWDDERRTIEQVNFDALSISAVQAYRVGARVIRVLHVERHGTPRAHNTALGFTAPVYDDAFLVSADVWYELTQGIWPARDERGQTELFGVTEDAVEAPWYRQFRAQVGAILRADIGADPNAFTRTHDALIQAVEVHELQHQIDYRDKLAVRGVFRQLADHLQNLRLASACMYETSAHLAQMARDPVYTRVVLAEIVSYGFSGACNDADCLAALVIVDELGSEFGIAEPGQLVLQASFDVRVLADRYTTLAAYPADDIAFAANQAWVRLFGRNLPDIERVDSDVATDIAAMWP